MMGVAPSGMEFICGKSGKSGKGETRGKGRGKRRERRQKVF